MVLLVGGPLDGIELPHVSMERDWLSVSPDAFATVEIDTLNNLGSLPKRKAVYRRRKPGVDVFDFVKYEES